MERNKEAKKGSLAAVNGIGLSRRRHRITALKNSPEEEGLMETVRSSERERAHKVERVGDRDQESMSQRKRRRMGRCLERSKQRDVEGAGDEDSSGPSGEENYEEDYEETSLSVSNLALQRTVTPIRNFRSMSGLRIVDEMIVTSVPRRARSASVKRLNKQWNWGFGERQTRRRSPLGGSVDTVSPSSSSVSLRRKMKPLRPKGLLSKVSRKPPPSVEDDIEIEVVEALFDLMKQSQSQSCKKVERIHNNISTENLDLIGNDDFHTKSIGSPTISGQTGPEAPVLPPEISSISSALPDGELNNVSELKVGKMSFDALEPTEAVSLEKEKDSSEPAQKSVAGDQVVVTKEEESGSSEKSSGDDFLDSTMSKANLASDAVVPLQKRETSFEIDLMAPPPIPSSPDQDGSKIRVPEPEQDDVSSCSSYNSSQQGVPKEPNHSVVSDSKRHNFGHLNSLPSPSGWQGTFPPPGYTAPLKTLIPMNQSSGTAASLIAPFNLSHPRSRRCVTHQYIACNIRQHQQLSKNSVLPPATGHATLHEAKFISGNPATSTSNSFLGIPFQRDLPGMHALATPSVLSAKGKSSEVTKADATKCMQPVPQQTLEKALGGNLLQPALVFPLGQHQAANVASRQPGSNISIGVMGKAALSSNPAGVPLVGSLSLPAGAAAMSFNCANLSASDASPFMTILQTNMYPYSTSTNSGMPLSVRGAQAPVFPFLNAPYYPSVFSTPQNQQKQSTCQPQSLYQVQQASSTTGTCSGSKSSYKQSKSQQQIVIQTSAHCSFGSEGLQLEQLQKQNLLGSHSSSKSVDNPGSHAQKASKGQNHGFPFQTMNFALVSHGDGKQQQQGSLHSVAVNPSQAIGFSFDLNASTKQGFNSSALPQETAVVQMLSDVAQLGYQFVPSAQVPQHKIFQVTDNRNVVKSTNTGDEKKTLLTKSVDRSLSFSKLDSSDLLASTRKKVAVDGSAQNQRSLPPPTTGSQSFSSSSTGLTAAFSDSAAKSQQEQQRKEMIQLQKQRTQQMQLTSTAQIQAPFSNNFHYSFNGCNPNNNPMFSLVHNNYLQSSQWKNMSIATSTQAPSLSTTSSLRNLPQQQTRNSPGQPLVSFGSSLNSATLSQGQQFIINSQPTSSIVDGHLEVAT